MNPCLLSPDPNNTSLPEIGMRAWHADHLNRKVLAHGQEERKSGQPQAIGAHVRNPAHQLGAIRAAHGSRHIDGKSLLGTSGLRQVPHDRGQV
ncbi:MAG: hypothetical protein AUG04_01310 [Deltaproteobacteria bacterium 13_1_20CM_2_69_21]|nr:MAG: hypothetical protein AUG04_01310 [Deltaproteobacteria bacterium 13_1_20CM_2_69_21]